MKNRSYIGNENDGRWYEAGGLIGPRHRVSSQDDFSTDVKMGEQIKFVIKNVGTIKHEFHLDTVADNASHRREMEKNPEMVHDDPNAQTVEPGKETEILWNFSKPGVFEFACLIPGHYQAGMHSKVVVK